MALKLNDFNFEITGLLELLSIIQSNNPKSLNSVHTARLDAQDIIAEKTGINKIRISYLITEKLNLTSIRQFENLVYGWLGESDPKLYEMLLDKSKSDIERKAISDFYSIDNRSPFLDKTSLTATASYRSISQDELDDILRKHQLWLKSKGEKGELANFERISLKGNELMDLNLEKANFSSSLLEDVDLRKANLAEALFVGSNIINTNFKGANLNGANFTNADLKDIDFNHAELQDIVWTNVNVYNIKGISKDVENLIESQGNLSQDSKSVEEMLDEIESKKRISKIDIASRVLTDKPSEIDLLNFSDYAEALKDFIINAKTKKPISIAIDAPWGGGKSTLMAMIKKMIESKSMDKEQSFITIWFNAWKYEKEESLWAALVLNILKTIRSKYGFCKKIGLWIKLNLKRFDKKLFFDNFFYSLLNLLLLFIIGFIFILFYWLIFQDNLILEYLKYAGFTGTIGFFFKVGSELYKRLTGPFNLKITSYIKKPKYEESVGFIAQFEEDFKNVIETVTNKGKWPLIIFIDDLDRCAAPKPVEVIEAINLLLDSEHCVFVIGMDSKGVAASIESKYKDMKENLEKQKISNEEIRLGQRFLEKIIQVHFHIPKIKPDLLKSYIDSLMSSTEPEKPEPKERDLSEIEEILESEQREGKSLDEAEKVVRNKRPGSSNEKIKKAKEEVRAKTFDDSIETKTAIVNAARLLSSNPRKIKRFINNFRLQSFIANRRGLFEDASINLDVLAKSVTISTRWPDIYEWVAKDSSLLTEVKKTINIKEEIENLTREIKQDIESENERKAKIEKLESELKHYKEQPFISSCLENEDILAMINNLSEYDIEKIQDCIYMTNMTTSESAA